MVQLHVEHRSNNIKPVTAKEEEILWTWFSWDQLPRLLSSNTVNNRIWRFHPVDTRCSFWEDVDDKHDKHDEDDEDDEDDEHDERDEHDEYDEDDEDDEQFGGAEKMSRKLNLQIIGGSQIWNSLYSSFHSNLSIRCICTQLTFPAFNQYS